MRNHSESCEEKPLPGEHQMTSLGSPSMSVQELKEAGVHVESRSLRWGSERGPQVWFVPSGHVAGCSTTRRWLLKAGFRHDFGNAQLGSGWTR